jgi:hypothetical protein
MSWDMTKTRHTDEQTAFALKQTETGMSVAEVIDGAALNATDAVPACWTAQGKTMLAASPAGA